MSRRNLLQASASGALVAAGLNITCPAGQSWLIRGITVLLTTTATAGNRRVTVELLDGASAVLAVLVHGQVVAASVTTSVNFGLGGYSQTAAGSTPLIAVWDGMPELVLRAGQRLRVTDQAGIDITDTAKVYVHGELERP